MLWNKKNSGFRIKPCILISDKYIFRDVYENPYYKADYVFDVELVVVNDLQLHNSITDIDEFKEYVLEQQNININKNYNDENNIRDFYSTDIHLAGQRTEIIERFNVLNNLVLNYSDKITRRTTKHGIVYKLDKCKSILTIRIFKNGNISLYTLTDSKIFDYKKMFIPIPKSYRLPYENQFVLTTTDDLQYIEGILINYLDRILK